MKELRHLFPLKLLNVETKTLSNVSNKKDTKTDSVNAVQVSLSLARNMFLKYVTKSVFMKLQAFIKNGNEGLCNGVCF